MSKLAMMNMMYGKVDVAEMIHMNIDELLGKEVDWSAKYKPEDMKHLAGIFIELKEYISEVTYRLPALDEKEMKEKLDQKGIQEEVSKMIMLAIIGRKEEIHYHYKVNTSHISSMSVNKIDWKYSIILGSSLITRNHEKVVKLAIRMKGGQVHWIEMNQQGLQAFLQQCRQIKQLINEL